MSTIECECGITFACYRCPGLDCQKEHASPGAERIATLEREHREACEDVRRRAHRESELERELAEARDELNHARQIVGGQPCEHEAKLTAVARLLQACAAVREISERPDALMSELRACLTEHVLREILACAALAPPAQAEPRCDCHKHERQVCNICQNHDPNEPDAPAEPKEEPCPPQVVDLFAALSESLRKEKP